MGRSCAQVENLTAAEMVRLFGPQVCKSVSQDGTCTLTQVAKAWMNEINQIVANGHCEGMAVLSSLFYSGLADPSDYGASSVNNLKLLNNRALQREIAYWVTTQWFMDDYLIEKDPTTQLKYLVSHFNSDPDTPIPLGIYQRNRSGGHAITAYAVIDHGDGIYYVMVYDNNYPNEERYITINTNKNSWSYKTAVNTWSSVGDYSGQGKNNMIQIGPVEPRLGTFKCDFCNNQASSGWDSWNPWAPYTPSQPSQPSQPSDGYDSIWDILSPWISPSDSGGGYEPYVIPTQTPAPYQPSQPSDGYDSIWDILSPWMSPSESDSYVSPTAVPDSSSQPYSIWDILSPWMSPDGGSSSSSGSDSYLFPTQTPQTRQPTAVPALPVTRPTAVPAPVESNKISVSSDINIYIETDNDQRAGFDWETEETFEEIPGVEIGHSMGRTSAVLPTNLKYYLWMNYPESKSYKTFDATITSPGRYLRLTNIPEAYAEPNFVYSPPTTYKVNKKSIEFESFEIMATADQLPGIEFVITDEYGEYSFIFDTELDLGRSKKVPDAAVDFLIFHNYDEGEIGIWISAVDDKDADLFKNCKFDVSGVFTLYDDEGELQVSTPKNKPITLKNNGMFFINYLDWQEGKGLMVEADLDGDDDYETLRELK